MERPAEIPCFIRRLMKRYTFLRYAFVGGVAAAIHYGIYYALIAADMNYNVAYTLGVAVSLAFNFYASNRYTFNTRPTAGRGLRFLVAHGANFLLSLALLNLYVWCGISPYWAPPFVLMVAVPVNFLFVRFSLTGRTGLRDGRKCESEHPI